MKFYDDLIPKPQSLLQSKPSFSEEDHKIDLYEKHKIYTKINNHFTYFALIASLNHALAYVVASYSSSILDPLLASIILGLLWCLNSVSGLFCATFITKYFGYKWAMVLALWGYTVQIIGLYVSILIPAYSWSINITAAILGGITSAVWWTAQGVCFEITCEKLSSCQPTNNSLFPATSSTSSHINEDQHLRQLNEIRSNLSARWTMIYQFADILVFLCLSVLPIYFHIDFNSVILLLVIMGVATSLLGTTFDSLGNYPTLLNKQEIFESVIAVPKQFLTDARASLIAPFVFGFGITTAMFAYYINGKIIDESPSLGLLSIGLLEAFSYLVAALSAFPYAYVTNSSAMGGHIVMQFGSFAFMLTGVFVVLLTSKDLSALSTILVISGLYGLGRGVFEGACRATYAELFAGEHLSTAFSSQTLLAGISGGICFFLFERCSGFTIGMITVFNGALALVSYGTMISHPDFHKPIAWSELFPVVSSIFKLGSSDSNNWFSGSSRRGSSSIPTLSANVNVDEIESNSLLRSG